MKINLRQTSVFFLAILSFWSMSICRVYATTNGWSSLGPLGGPVINVVVSPFQSSIIFRGDQYSGIWKSEDGGDTWIAASQGVTGSIRRLIAVKTGPSSFSLLAMTIAGLFRSTDQGAHWNSIEMHDQNACTRFLANQTLQSLGSTVYVGESFGDFTVNGITIRCGGISRSDDGGNSWTRLNNTSQFDMADLLVTSEGEVYASVSSAPSSLLSSGLLKSADKGATWSAVPIATSMGPSNASDIIDSFADTLVVNPMVCTSANDSTQRTCQRPGFYESKDRGATWRIAPHLAAITVSTIVAFGGQFFTEKVPDGLVKSSDGIHWEPVENHFSDQKIFTAAATDSTLYVGTPVGLFKSSDQGTHWKEINGDIKGHVVIHVVSSGGNLFCLARGGFFRSPDSGASWTSLELPFAAYTLAAFGDTLYTESRGKLFKSTDQGSSWSAGSEMPSGYYTNLLAVAGPEIYAALRAKSDSANIFYKRADQGTAWQVVPIPTNHAVTAVASSGDIIYAGTNEGEVFKSADRGATWSQVTRIMDPNAVSELSLAASGSTLFESINRKGVFKSTDQGITWTPISPDVPSLRVTALAAPFLGALTLLAGTEGGSVLGCGNECLANQEDASRNIRSNNSRPGSGRGCSLLPSVPQQR